MINWFPGHMNKTLKQMQADSRLCDCFIYVLDARCPTSCINPEFIKVINNKPIIYVLNKADLIGFEDVKKLKSKFSINGNSCISLNATQTNSAKVIITEINKIFKTKLEQNAQKQANFITRAMILGVPNSGKSTIVNNLCGKTKAITGNKAGVTRNKQWLRLGSVEIMDTPGVLLPNFEDEDLAYNLAIVGSVKDEVINIVEVACQLLKKLYLIDSNIINAKYGVDTNNNTQLIDNKMLYQLLANIGKKRGCIIKGGEVDLERSAKLLLTDFRSGKLGKICLENV